MNLRVFIHGNVIATELNHCSGIHSKVRIIAPN